MTHPAAPQPTAQSPRMPVLAAFAALSPRKAEPATPPRRRFTDWAMI
jgi:hypothetical protein